MDYLEDPNLCPHEKSSRIFREPAEAAGNGHQHPRKKAGPGIKYVSGKISSKNRSLRTGAPEIITNKAPLKGYCRGESNQIFYSIFSYIRLNPCANRAMAFAFLGRPGLWPSRSPSRGRFGRSLPQVDLVGQHVHKIAFIDCFSKSIPNIWFFN